MLIGENIVLALRSLASNKMRAFLTMLGIIIGIASVIAIFTVGNSLTLSVSENMQSLGANDIYVTVSPRSENEERDPSATIDGISFGNSGSSASLMDADEDDYITAEMLRDMAAEFGDRIYAINAQMQVGSGSISVGREDATVSVSGVSAGYFVTNQVDMLAGNMFQPRDLNDRRMVCLMDKNTAENLFDSVSSAVGKQIEVTISGSDQEFTIIGVYENASASSMGSMMMFSSGSLYIPLQTAAAITHEEEAFQYVQVIAGVGEDTEKLASDITDFFVPYYRANTDYRVAAMTLASMVDMLDQLLGTITTAISIIAGISLLVGGIGVMNIMLVSVTERTKEIGTRKALGAKNSSIRLQFIIEAMIICLIGGLIGLGLGMVLGVFASNVLGYPARASISGIIISITFSMGIGLFFGYFPANKAAKMNPIDALRYE